MRAALYVNPKSLPVDLAIETESGLDIAPWVFCEAVELNLQGDRLGNIAGSWVTHAAHIPHCSSFHFGGGGDRRVFFDIKEVTAHEVAVALFVLRMDRLYVYTYLYGCIAEIIRF